MGPQSGPPGVAEVDDDFDCVMIEEDDDAPVASSIGAVATFNFMCDGLDCTGSTNACVAPSSSSAWRIIAILIAAAMMRLLLLKLQWLVCLL